MRGGKPGTVTGFRRKPGDSPGFPGRGLLRRSAEPVVSACRHQEGHPRAAWFIPLWGHQYLSSSVVSVTVRWSQSGRELGETFQTLSLGAAPPSLPGPRSAERRSHKSHGINREDFTTEAPEITEKRRRGEGGESGT